MKRSTEQILTTHTGGIGRERELTARLADGDSAATLDPAVHDAVIDVVDRQVALGISVVNDGDQSRTTTARYASERLSGVQLRKGSSGEPARHPEEWEFPEFFARAYPDPADHRDRAVCTGPVAWAGEATLKRDLENLASATSDADFAEVFLSAPSPGTLAHALGDEFYGHRKELDLAVADALKVQYAAIVEAGLVLQVELAWPGTRSRLFDDVELLNHALDGVPAESVRVWLSLGADEGPHNRDPELRDVIDIVLAADAAGLCVVAANGRHEADCELWAERMLPDGKVLIPGVIDPTTNIIEHPLTVAERIARFATLVGRENVIAGVDSSFEPTPGLYQEFHVTRDVMWAKLRSLVQGAELATQQQARAS